MTSVSLIEEARFAIAHGEISKARKHLLAIVRNDPTDGVAWYLLSQFVESQDDKQRCLHFAIKHGYHEDSKADLISNQTQINSSAPQKDTRTKSRKISLVSKSFFFYILGLISPLLIANAFFYIRTGQLPSLSATERRYQIATIYFSTARPVVLRPVYIRGQTGSPSWIAFQKDAYFDSILNNNIASEDQEAYKFDNRVVILEDVDFGIFSPIIGFIWPFDKVFDINFPDESGGLRLFDVSTIYRQLQYRKIAVLDSLIFMDTRIWISEEEYLLCFLPLG